MRVLFAGAPRLGRPLAAMLAHREFVCDTVEGSDGLEFGELDYDALLLDLEQIEPDTVPRLRAAGVSLPIVALSRGRDCEAVLAQGADDFLTVPCNIGELVARLHARIRRSHGHTASRITIGPLVVDIDEHIACLDGTPMHLTGKETATLELLALRQGRCVTKEQFAMHMYPDGTEEPALKIIDVFVCKLRKRLGHHRDLIETVWGRGYILRVPPQATQAVPDHSEQRLAA